MRLIKMLGLAMVAAIAVMAFIGASTASAAPDEVTICKLNPGASLCPAGESFPEGTEILGTATDPRLLGTINQLCATSHAAFRIEGPNNSLGMGDHLEFKPIGQGLTFSGCEPCSTIETSLGVGTILHDVSGDFTLTGTGSAKLSGCPFSIKCKFEGTATLLIKNTGTGSLIHAEDELLKRTEGAAFFCGDHGFWDALYTVTGKWASLTADLRP